MFVSATSPVVLCKYNFVFNFLKFITILLSLPSWVAANYQSAFMLPVGLCKRKMTRAHPILTIIFKKVLRN